MTPHLDAEIPPPPGPWVEQAACKGLPTDWWFSEQGANRVHATAVAICNTCPVLDPCRAYGLTHSSLVGTWGGLSHRGRRLERRRLRQGAA